MSTENDGEAPLSGFELLFRTVARVLATAAGGLAGLAALCLILGGMTVVWIFRILVAALPLVIGALILYWLLI